MSPMGRPFSKKQTFGAVIETHFVISRKFEFLKCDDVFALMLYGINSKWF